VLPWNWPLFQLAGKLVPALLAGNTVVIKPSPLASLVVGRVVDALARVLPAGSVSTVLGPVETTVRALLTDRRVDLISFTGSVATGRRILALAAEGPTRAVLELGGNDPAVLLEDVELDRKTVVALMQSMFTTTGQGCQLIKRLLVHRSRADELVHLLREGIDAYYRLGHGLAPDTTMGPLVDETQMRRVQRLIDDAVAGGAEAVPLGEGPDRAAADGWFIRPTLVLGSDRTAALVREEQFGPAVPVLTFENDDEAIELANEGPYGLGSSIWSADTERAARLADRLEAGATYLGNHNAFAVFRDTAVGGIGDSGIGVEWGEEGLLEYTRPHVVSRRRK
jgi:acyl-CoA reductase-like NAD-dependent aldehyde dehydrogenase